MYFFPSCQFITHHRNPPPRSDLPAPLPLPKKNKKTLSSVSQQIQSQTPKYISIPYPSQSNNIDDIIFQYEKVFNLNTRFGDRVKVLVLEVPYYSVSIWNFHKGHPDQTAFQETDKILFNRISDLNERIKSLNQSHGVVFPRFSADLIRCRKSNKNHPSKSVSYSLLLDGIHPSVTLSKYWIRRLVLSVICKLCFH